MPIRLTDSSFFTEKLDADYPGLEGIDRTFTEEGADTAERRFAAFIRAGALDSGRFFADRPSVQPTEEELARGERILDGWLSSVGVPMHFEGRRVDWFANPTYNDYREWPWQLSRHAEWSFLGSLYRATKDERYAEAFSDYFMSWAEQTEVPENESGFATVAWRTLEAGIRLGSTWASAAMCFFRSPSLSDHALTCFFKSLWENAWRVRFFNTSHNWLIAEMEGLSTFGILFPFFRDAAPWETYATDRLIEELDLQIYPDHFQQELTTGYHTCVLRDYLGTIYLHRRMNRPISDRLVDRVADLYLLYIQLMKPDGKTPDLNDGGRIDVAEMCRTALRTFPDRETDFRFFASDRTEGDVPDYRSIAMEYSGHTVLRSGWGTDDCYAMLENSPFGRAHQHEDKLQILLSAYGKCLLDDLGSFAYDSSAMRSYVVSSYSHNTALVDLMGQNRRNGYRWKKEDIAVKAGTRFRFTEECEIAAGEYHDGYGPDKLPVRHERTLLWMKRGIGGTALPFWIVYDRFTPQDGAEHDYTLLWHLEDVTAEINGKTITSDYGDGVTFSLVGNGEPTLIRGQKEPLFLGWHPNRAPGEHEHYPTPTALVSRHGAECAMITVLFPTKNAACPVTEADCDGNGKVTLTLLGKTETISLPELF